MWAVVQDRPSAPGKAASSGFAAQLSRATQAAQADQAGGGGLCCARGAREGGRWRSWPPSG